MSDLMHKNLNALDEEHLRDVNGGGRQYPFRGRCATPTGVSSLNMMYAEAEAESRIRDRLVMSLDLMQGDIAP